MLLEEYPKAISLFDGAIKSDSLNQLNDKYLKRAIAYLMNKDYSTSIADFEVYGRQQEATKDVLFHEKYGLALLYANRNDDAYKTLDSFRSNAPCSLALGWYYAKVSRYEEALVCFDHAFSSGTIKKTDLKIPERAFLTEMNRNSKYRNNYSELKNKYIP